MGHTYATAEHAFQAAKCIDEREAERVRQAPSPAAAKQIGRRVRLRVDWDEVRVEVMRAVLAAKFSKLASVAGFHLIASGRVSLIGDSNIDGIAEPADTAPGRARSTAAAQAA